jgi:DNA/RNA-binding domain of Phe-tRNA-synthetase-like protein
MNRPIEFWLDRKADEIGVRFDVAVIRDVQVRREDGELEKWKRPIQKQLRDSDLEADTILSAYRPVLTAAGNPSAVASPEYLLTMIRKHGRLPRINTVVDAYNIVSAQTRAVASAHDLDRLTGPVRLIRLDSPAAFEPLGSRDTETIPAGEFGVRDDRHMLCRLNCKQSRLSSVGTSTKSILIYVQGNPALEGHELASTLDLICETVIRFNGGNRTDVLRLEPPVREVACGANGASEIDGESV